nr:ataxia telangiectasia mutated family protein [Tanacetum cinerariifolium]
MLHPFGTLSRLLELRHSLTFQQMIICLWILSNPYEAARAWFHGNVTIVPGYRKIKFPKNINLEVEHTYDDLHAGITGRKERAADDYEKRHHQFDQRDQSAREQGYSSSEETKIVVRLYLGFCGLDLQKGILANYQLVRFKACPQPTDVSAHHYFWPRGTYPRLIQVLSDRITGDHRDEVLKKDVNMSVEQVFDGILGDLPGDFKKVLKDNGLRVSREKTVYLRCDFGIEKIAHNEEVDLRIGDMILQPKESFRYLGSMLHKSGRIDEDVANRIKVAWMKWRAATRVLCDRNVPLKLKGKFYRVAIRPAMLYGSECWPITKAVANRVEVAELRMLRWTCGKTLLDMIPNGVYRAQLEVESIINKMREVRLRCFRHVKRRPESAPVRRVESLVVDELRIRGRPKLRRKDIVKHDMKELLFSEDMTSDRNAWRARTSVKLATTLTFSMIVLLAFTCSGTMAQEFGAAPAPSPSMESTGMALQVPALLAVVVSLVAYLF